MYGMENFATILEGFAENNIPPHDGSEKSYPAQQHLPEYPAALIDKVFDNATAHPLLTMSHIDKHGNAFCSVMGFSYIDGKINITSRRNAGKVPGLRRNPGFSIIYHNNVPRPEALACITLVGTAELSDDQDRIEAANVALCHKVFRDNDPDVGRRQAMIESMREADRILITMAQVNAVYIVSPMLPGLPAGIPTPVISWRADRGR